MGKISVETDNVFRVSSQGKEVDSATPEECTIHSGFTYEMVKEDSEGYIDYTSPLVLKANTSYTVATINHNFGYVPEFQVFAQDIEGEYFAELPLGFLSTGIKYDAKIDEENLIILLVNGNDYDWDSTPVGMSYRFRYQIFVNQLNSV